MTILPDTRQRIHSHQVQTEVFYILEGEATITINLPEEGEDSHWYE